MCYLHLCDIDNGCKVTAKLLGTVSLWGEVWAELMTLEICAVLEDSYWETLQ